MKKGLTLIELIIVFSIMIITTSIAVMSPKLYRQHKNYISYKFNENNILNFIQNSRQKCRENNKSGMLAIDVIHNNISFLIEGSLQKNLQLEKDIKLSHKNIGSTHGILTIDNKGSLNEAGEIIFFDSIGNSHSIVIGVGTDNVRIKEYIGIKE